MRKTFAWIFAAALSVSVAATTGPASAAPIRTAAPTMPAQTGVDVIQAQAIGGDWRRGGQRNWRGGNHWRGGKHWRGGQRWHGGRHWQGGRHHARPHYRHHRGRHFGPAIGGLLGGAIIGGIIANQSRGPYYSGDAHVDWCLRRYRSYDVRSDTFQPYHGPRRACNSPYG